MRKEKQLLLDEGKDKIVAMPSFVLIRYEKMSANTTNAFRGELEKIGGELEIVRKRVFLKALEAAGIEGVDSRMLEGHIGVVFAKDDPVVVTKALYAFKKESEGDVIDIIGGRIDGTVYLAADIERLSQLPGKDQMRAELLATLEAPMVQTVSVMNALLTSIMHCMENKSKKEEQ